MCNKTYKEVNVINKYKAKLVESITDSKGNIICKNNIVEVSYSNGYNTGRLKGLLTDIDIDRDTITIDCSYIYHADIVTIDIKCIYSIKISND